MQKKTQEIGDNVEEVFPYLLGIQEITRLWRMPLTLPLAWATLGTKLVPGYTYLPVRWLAQLAHAKQANSPLNFFQPLELHVLSSMWYYKLCTHAFTLSKSI